MALDPDDKREMIEHVDRRRLIQHVEYEVVMLRGSLVEFTKRDQGGVMDLEVDAPRRIARTAFLEVFLVHARALDDFLGTERKYADDLWAGDFIGSSWRPHEETTPLARVSPRIREEINKPRYDRPPIRCHRGTRNATDPNRNQGIRPPRQNCVRRPPRRAAQPTAREALLKVLTEDVPADGPALHQRQG